MIDIDPALRSTLGFHIGYEKDSMHAKLAGTLRQIGNFGEGKPPVFFHIIFHMHGSTRAAGLSRAISQYLAMQLRAWDQIDLSILAIPIWVRNYGKEVPTAVARYWMRASCSLVNARTMQ